MKFFDMTNHSDEVLYSRNVVKVREEVGVRSIGTCYAFSDLLLIISNNRSKLYRTEITTREHSLGSRDSYSLDFLCFFPYVLH